MMKRRVAVLLVLILLMVSVVATATATAASANPGCRAFGEGIVAADVPHRTVSDIPAGQVPAVINGLKEVCVL